MDRFVVSVVLYTRPGCHLCDDMKAVVQEVARSVPLTLQEIDISSDTQLEARYRNDIPVLTINGRPAAKHRVTEAALLRILAARRIKN